MLANFIVGSGADGSSPAAHALRSGIFKNGLIGSGDEGRGVVHGYHSYVKALRSGGIAAAIGRAAVIVQSDGHEGRPAEIWSRLVGECAGWSDCRQHNEKVR